MLTSTFRRPRCAIAMTDFDDAVRTGTLNRFVQHRDQAFAAFEAETFRAGILVRAGSVSRPSAAVRRSRIMRFFRLRRIRDGNAPLSEALLDPQLFRRIDDVHVFRTDAAAIRMSRAPRRCRAASPSPRRRRTSRSGTPYRGRPRTGGGRPDRAPASTVVPSCPADRSWRVCDRGARYAAISSVHAHLLALRVADDIALLTDAGPRRGAGCARSVRNAGSHVLCGTSTRSRLRRAATSRSTSRHSRWHLVRIHSRAGCRTAPRCTRRCPPVDSCDRP